MMRYLLSTFLLTLSLVSSAAAPFTVGKPLPPWQTGELDIYHIHEGRGNATFMIFPDGSTLLYDLGSVAAKSQQTTVLPKYSNTLPNNNKPPYAWVAHFIQQFSPHPKELNYLVISHYHFDHMGEWDSNRKEANSGGYKLFGVTGLAQALHIDTLIDRSYPDYEHHGDIPGKLSNDLHSKNEYARLTALTMQNYQRFVYYQIKHNHLKAEKFIVGSNTQIREQYHLTKSFKVKNIIGNGYVWTGKGSGTYHFIKYAINNTLGNKIENDFSLGIRIDDGAFRYFTGGDMTGRVLTGKDINSSAEAVAAPIVGHVDVATLNHHGFDDAQSEIWVKTLRPCVWIQQNWAASQTSLPMILRTFDSHSYAQKRELFALHHFALNDLELPSLGGPHHQNPINQYYKDTMGHVVVRVMSGGKQFWVIILTSNTDNPVIKAFYGPYSSARK